MSRIHDRLRFWVRFDDHGEQHDIYDYQLEKIEKKVEGGRDAA